MTMGPRLLLEMLREERRNLTKWRDSSLDEYMVAQSRLRRVEERLRALGEEV